MTHTIAPADTARAAAGPPDSRAATKMQGVSTLLAVPQWYVNLQLDKLLRTGRTTTGGSLKDAALRMPGASDPWLAGQLSQLATTIYVAGSPAVMRLLVTFGSGSLQYDNGKSCDIGGLRLVVTADLGRARPRGYEQGGFTIEQFFMDLQAASAVSYNPSTSFPPSMPDAAKQQFPNLLAKYLQGAAAAGGTLLGYAVPVPAAGEPAATAPITSLQLVSNQFTRNSAPTEDPDLDTVTYLAMAGGKPFPRNLNRWWGNFVGPDDGRNAELGWYGTIAVARDVLLDYLDSAVSPEVCGYWKLKNADATTAMQHDPGTGTLQKTGDGARWQSGELHSRSRLKNSASTDDGDFWFSWNVDLAAQPGRTTVSITRKATFKVRATHWYGIADHAATAYLQYNYDIPLTVTIALLGVMDGKLQVSVTTSTKQPNPNTNYAQPYGWYLTGTERGGSATNDDIARTMRNTLDNAVKAAVPEVLASGIETRISTILNRKPFVLPGGSQLNMINPSFNDERDLLLGVSYKA
jgi:hypothetical protein